MMHLPLLICAHLQHVNSFQILCHMLGPVFSPFHLYKLIKRKALHFTPIETFMLGNFQSFYFFIYYLFVMGQSNSLTTKKIKIKWEAFHLINKT
jgi:hypothetical protein